MAGLEFAPLKVDASTWRPPTNVEWTALANPHLISVRLAWLTLQKSKDELVGISEEHGDKALMELVEQIGQSADWFNGLRQVQEAAECRLMCALAARTLDDRA